MAESTLAITYTSVRKSVADFLGWGRDSTKWNSDQGERIEDVMLTGLRQFYWPAFGDSYSWKFLEPTRTLALVAGTTDYDLPDDFGQMCGNVMTLQSDVQPQFICFTSEPEIRKKRQSAASGQRPQFAAWRPKEFSSESSSSAGQRHELLVWPSPDKAYTAEYVCQVVPFSLSSQRLYPHGGAFHAETILQSCIAAAELRINDMRGPQWETFMERLQASRAFDERSGPRNLGQMRGHADESGWTPQRHEGSYVVTINGVDPS